MKKRLYFDKPDFIWKMSLSEVFLAYYYLYTMQVGWLKISNIKTITLILNSLSHYASEYSLCTITANTHAILSIKP